MAEHADDRRLVDAARSNPTRFAELYELYFDRIFAYVARRVREREIAEDVTSEVFRRALAALAGYESRDTPFSAWLYRIATNAIADQRKTAARETEIELDQIAAEDDVEASERAARLFGLVTELPADQRRVIELRFAEGWSHREIAAELGRTEGAVKQLQLRGLLGLRARMGVSHA